MSPPQNPKIGHHNVTSAIIQLSYFTKLTSLHCHSAVRVQQTLCVYVYVLQVSSNITEREQIYKHSWKSLFLVLVDVALLRKLQIYITAVLSTTAERKMPNCPSDVAALKPFENSHNEV